MSANNVIVLKEHKGKFLGFHITAENTGVLSDQIVSEDDACIGADTKSEIEALATIKTKQEYIEYDWVWDYLPKDGTFVKVVDNETYKRVEELENAIEKKIYKSYPQEAD